jgi:hypothetical protein
VGRREQQEADEREGRELSDDEDLRQAFRECRSVREQEAVEGIHVVTSASNAGNSCAMIARHRS